MSVSETPQETLARTLRAIGHSMPTDGLAALRLWGQTGERSAAWIAAADPVHLEARLDHLRLYAFCVDDVPRSDLRKLFASMQEFVGGDERFAFARLGPLVYLRSSEPIATSAVSPAVVDGREPDEYMPTGETARAHDLLLSELQMALHDHEVNRHRAASGDRTVNSIWLWGGGIAPDPEERPIPPVFSDDPLIRGYWLSCTGVGNSWTEDFEQALSIAPQGFVAVAPDETNPARRDTMTDRLDRLRVVLKRGDLARLTLLFRDGLSIEIETSDVFRFWRSVSPLLQEEDYDD